MDLKSRCITSFKIFVFGVFDTGDICRRFGGFGGSQCQRPRLQISSSKGSAKKMDL